MPDNRLLLDTPTAVASAPTTIHHPELRQILVCPEERGRLNYLCKTCLCSQNIADAGSAPSVLYNIHFAPVCLTYGSGILVAGGLGGELAVRPLHGPRWSYNDIVPGRTINNSLFITSAFLPQDRPESSARARLFVSSNECMVVAYDIWKSEWSDETDCCRLKRTGQMKFPTPINHASLSPDDRTLLAVGDTSDVFLLDVAGGDTTTFSSITKYTASDASFSTSWAADGRKFAVASADGGVSIWDVRSSRPLAKFRAAPGCATRAIRFTPAGAPHNLLAFTENVDRVHVIDAATFTEHAVYTIPTPMCAAALPRGSKLSYCPYRGFSVSDEPGVMPPLDSRNELNISGVCWDPTGQWLYVSTKDTIVEYEVAGRERTWSDSVQFI